MAAAPSPAAQLPTNSGEPGGGEDRGVGAHAGDQQDGRPGDLLDRVLVLVRREHREQHGGGDRDEADVLVEDQRDGGDGDEREQGERRGRGGAGHGLRHVRAGRSGWRRCRAAGRRSARTPVPTPPPPVAQVPPPAARRPSAASRVEAHASSGSRPPRTTKRTAARIDVDDQAGQEDRQLAGGQPGRLHHRVGDGAVDADRREAAGLGAVDDDHAHHQRADLVAAGEAEGDRADDRAGGRAGGADRGDQRGDARTSPTGSAPRGRRRP